MSRLLVYAPPPPLYILYRFTLQSRYRKLLHKTTRLSVNSYTIRVFSDKPLNSILHAGTAQTVIRLEKKKMCKTYTEITSREHKVVCI